MTLNDISVQNKLFYIEILPVVIVTHTKLKLVPTTLGHGKDYFDQMFNDLKKDLTRTREAFPAGPVSSGPSPYDRPHNPEPGNTAPERSYSSMTHDYNTSTSR